MNKPLVFSNLNAKNSNWQNTYRIDITNKYISEILSDIGMIQNKSLVLEFPSKIDKSLYPHFLRDYFDGDGHIECEKTKFLTIASTLQFCQFVKDFCAENLNINCSIYNTYNKDSNTKILVVHSKSSIKGFLDFIYHDADLYIQRNMIFIKTFVKK